MDRNGLLTIGEFSEWTGISRSALIFYDEAGVFHPARRGENNYRYYSYFQTITVNLINTLKSLDIPLNTIAALMRDRTPEALLELLSVKERELACEIERLQNAEKIIHVFSDNIRKGIAAENDSVSVRYLEGAAFSKGPPNTFGGDETFYAVFRKYCDDLRAQGGEMSYPIGGWWPSMEDFLDKPVQPSCFFSADPGGKHYRHAGRYLVGYTRCFYGQVNDLPERMMNYARGNGLEFEGPMFNLFLLDEVSTVDPGQYLLQASIMVV